MNNEGFEIKIKTGISEEEAKDEFDRYLKDYEDFLNKQRIIEAKYAKNKSTILADDIEEESKDYASSYGEFIIQGEELKTLMMQRKHLVKLFIQLSSKIKMVKNFIEKTSLLQVEH